MERVTAEINFIKIALDSFTIYQDENERTAFLDSEILKICDQTLRIQLTVYAEMTKDKLDDLLLELQKQKVINLGSSKVPNDKLDSIEKKLDFLIEFYESQGKSKKGKSDGSQVSSKDYDNGNYMFKAFSFVTFDARNEGFTQEEFDTLRQELHKIIANIKRRVDEKNQTSSVIISSNSEDEVSIIQDEIFKLCDCLCRHYRQHYNEDILFTPDNDTHSTPLDNTLSASPSSSNVLSSATNKKGRVDYTFHGHQHCFSISLGLLEYKNINKEVYSTTGNGLLTSDGKKSIAQSFIQLKSHVNKLFNSMNVNPRLFVCLLTTGKKWMVLRRQYYRGQSFFHSQEVELLGQDNKLVDADSQQLQVVVNMLFYLLFSIKKVNEDISKKEEDFNRILHRDDDSNEDLRDEDDDLGLLNEEEHNNGRSVRKGKRKFHSKKRGGERHSNKKKASSGHSDSWKYAPITVENLLKHQELMK